MRNIVYNLDIDTTKASKSVDNLSQDMKALKKQTEETYAAMSVNIDVGGKTGGPAAAFNAINTSAGNASASVKRFKAQTETATDSLGKLKQAAANLAAIDFKNQVNSTAALNTQINQLNTNLNTFQKRASQGAGSNFADNSINSLRSKLEGLYAHRNNLEIKGMPKASQELKQFNHTIDQTERALRNLETAGKSKVFQRIADNARESFKIYSGITVVNLGYRLVENITQAAVSFEVTMDKVRAVTAGSTKDMEMLADMAKRLGAETVFSANEAAEAMAEFGAAGFSANQIMTALPGTLDLAAAGAIKIADAVNLSTSVMNAFGMKASDLERIGDVIAKSAALGTTTVAGMGDAMRDAAPAAANAGMALEETAAALVMLQNAGIPATMAGVSLRQAIIFLANDSSRASKRLREFGVEIKNEDGTLKSLSETFKEFQRVGLTALQVQSMLGAEAGRLSLVYKAGTPALERLTQQLKESGPAATRAAGGFRDTAGALQLLYESGFARNKSTEGLKEIFDSLTTPTKQVADAFNEMGVRIHDADGNIAPLGMILEQLKAKGFSAAESIKLFGEEAGPKLTALLGQTELGLAKLTANLEREGGAAAKMAEIMNNNFMGQVNQLSSTVESIGIEAFEGLKIILVPLMTVLIGVAEVVLKIVSAFSALAMVIKENGTLFLSITGAIIAFNTQAIISNSVMLYMAIRMRAIQVEGLLLNRLFGVQIASSLAASTQKLTLFSGALAILRNGLIGIATAAASFSMVIVNLVADMATKGIPTVVAFRSAVHGLQLAFATTPFGAIAVAIGLVASAGYAAYTAIEIWSDSQRRLNDLLLQAKEAIGEELVAVDELFRSYEGLNMTQEKRIEIINTINSTYGQYLSYQLSEAANLEMIRDAQARVNTEMINGEIIRQRNAKQQDIVKEVATREVDIQTTLSDLQRGGVPSSDIDRFKKDYENVKKASDAFNLLRVKETELRKNEEEVLQEGLSLERAMANEREVPFEGKKSPEELASLKKQSDETAKRYQDAVKNRDSVKKEFDSLVNETGGVDKSMKDLNDKYSKLTDTVFDINTVFSFKKDAIPLIDKVKDQINGFKAIADLQTTADAAMTGLVETKNINPESPIITTPPGGGRPKGGRDRDLKLKAWDFNDIFANVKPIEDNTKALYANEVAVKDNLAIRRQKSELDEAIDSFFQEADKEYLEMVKKNNEAALALDKDYYKEVEHIEKQHIDALEAVRLNNELPANMRDEDLELRLKNVLDVEQLNNFKLNLEKRYEQEKLVIQKAAFLQEEQLFQTSYRKRLEIFEKFIEEQGKKQAKLGKETVIEYLNLQKQIFDILGTDISRRGVLQIDYKLNLDVINERKKEIDELMTTAQNRITDMEKIQGDSSYPLAPLAPPPLVDPVNRDSAISQIRNKNQTYVPLAGDLQQINSQLAFEKKKLEDELKELKSITDQSLMDAKVISPLRGTYFTLEGGNFGELLNSTEDALESLTEVHNKTTLQLSQNNEEIRATVSEVQTYDAELKKLSLAKIGLDFSDAMKNISLDSELANEKVASLVKTTKDLEHISENARHRVFGLFERTPDEFGRIVGRDRNISDRKKGKVDGDINVAQSERKGVIHGIDGIVETDKKIADSVNELAKAEQKLLDIEASLARIYKEKEDPINPPTFDRNVELEGMKTSLETEKSLYKQSVESNIAKLEELNPVKAKLGDELQTLDRRIDNITMRKKIPGHSVWRQMTLEVNALIAQIEIAKKKRDDIDQKIRETKGELKELNMKIIAGDAQPGDIEQAEILTKSIAGSQGEQTSVDKEIAGYEAQKEKVESDFANWKDMTVKQRVIAVADLAQQISNVVIESLRSVWAAEEELLDAKLSAQQDKIDEFRDKALESKEQGDAETLQLEEERLEKLEAIKKKNLEKQKALAIVEMVINTAVMITKAAAEGSGVAAGITIALALASLAAGLVAAKLSSESALVGVGARTGGYTGDRGQYHPGIKEHGVTGWHHEGEYVFTKEKTSKYRPLFEDIHKGNVDLNDVYNRSQLYDRLQGALYGESDESKYSGNTNVLKDLHGNKLGGYIDSNKLSKAFDSFGINDKLERERLASILQSKSFKDILDGDKHGLNSGDAGSNMLNRNLSNLLFGGEHNGSTAALTRYGNTDEISRSYIKEMLKNTSLKDALKLTFSDFLIKDGNGGLLSSILDESKIANELFGDRDSIGKDTFSKGITGNTLLNYLTRGALGGHADSDKIGALLGQTHLGELIRGHDAKIMELKQRSLLENSKQTLRSVLNEENVTSRLNSIGGLKNNNSLLGISNFVSSMNSSRDLANMALRFNPEVIGSGVTVQNNIMLDVDELRSDIQRLSESMNNVANRPIVIDGNSMASSISEQQRLQSRIRARLK